MTNKTISFAVFLLVTLLYNFAFCISFANAGIYEGKVSYYLGDFQAAKLEWERLVSNDDSQSAQALIELGKLYAKGVGVKEDKEHAKKLYSQALERGEKIAYFFISRIVKPEESKIWLNKGALAGDKRSQRSLADKYRYGLRVNKDLEKAFYWYLKSAENGDSISQGIVSWMYAIGRGTTKNIQQAYKWEYIIMKCIGAFSRIKRQGALEKMSEVLTKGQISQANREANDWLSSKPPCEAGKSLKLETESRFREEKITIDQWKLIYAELLSLPGVYVNIGIGFNLIEIAGEPLMYSFTTQSNPAHPAILKWQQIMQGGKLKTMLTGYYGGSWLRYLVWKFRNS